MFLLLVSFTVFVYSMTLTASIENYNSNSVKLVHRYSFTSSAVDSISGIQWSGKLLGDAIFFNNSVVSFPTKSSSIHFPSGITSSYTAFTLVIFIESLIDILKVIYFYLRKFGFQL